MIQSILFRNGSLHTTALSEMLQNIPHILSVSTFTSVHGFVIFIVFVFFFIAYVWFDESPLNALCIIQMVFDILNHKGLRFTSGNWVFFFSYSKLFVFYGLLGKYWYG